MLQVDENWIDKITESIYFIVNGKKTDRISIPNDFPDNEIKQLIKYINILIDQNKQINDYVLAISNGELDYQISKINNEMVYAVKNLQARLRHLTWQTQQIAAGNYTHTVDFMGDFSVAFNSMVQQLKKSFHDLNEANEELKIAKDEAESANKAKSEFLANMSHEIRTPMNAILGFAEILSNKTSESEQKNYLNIILSSGNGLLAIINDILDLSKIEAGKLEIQPTFMDLKRTIIEIKQMFTRKAEDKCIDFLVNVDDDFPPGIFLDPVRIRQIILNLAGNSIKFTDKGFVRITARQSFDYDNPELLLQAYTVAENQNLDRNPEEKYCNIIITVEDTGIGIPPDQIDKIFKPFEQVSGQSVKKFGGTGLGLSISTRLVKLMNGRISATSEYRKGTIFKIELPQILYTDKVEVDKDEEKITELDITFSKANILLIDDVETNRLVVKTYLHNYGLDIIEAINENDAYDKLNENTISLILTGLRMKGMDGEALAKVFKGNDKTKNIPIIMISASAQKEDEERVNKFVDSFLILPIEKITLIKALKKYLPFSVNLTDIEKEAEISQEKNNNITKRTLTKAECAKYSQILDNFLKEWITLNKSRQINAIKDFIARTTKTAEDYSSEELYKYANDLSDAANSLKVVKIKNLLADFPKVADLIKNRLQV